MMAMVSPLTTSESLATGDEGEQVGELQRRLRHLGYYEREIDQRYGEATELATREFQRASGVAEDGRVDAETWEALDREAQFAGYDPYAGDDPYAHHPAVDSWSAEPGLVSDDGQWWWDGTQWAAVETTTASATVGETSSVDPSSFPDIYQGDAGEWVEYLDAMLTSAGF
jgi:peptidoglycan hydrolase-like protein with peptidoglycan-binding domain